MNLVRVINEETKLGEINLFLTQIILTLYMRLLGTRNQKTFHMVFQTKMVTDLQVF